MKVAAVTAGATALVAPVVLVTALIGGLTAVVTVVGVAAAGIDPAKLPPLARTLLPEITALTTSRCPELPPVWVVAHVAAESSWKPSAFSRDRNGGAAGLYQLNETNWIASGGRPWSSSPPPAQADVFDPHRHLELAIPFVCANLQTATAHLAETGKPTSPLDGMLVCHIAGCGRLLGSATGIPAAGEAGCQARCADLVARYIRSVHGYVQQFTAAGGPVDISTIPAPVAFDGAAGACSEPDPTTRGCLTPAMRHTLEQIFKVFGTPGPDSVIRSATCWDPHSWNPSSDHPKGKACDFFPTTAGVFPTGTDLENGWRLASWLRTHAEPLRVRYLIWQGRFWSPTTPDENGWGKPYDGGRIYDPEDATGGHHDHIHLSTR